MSCPPIFLRPPRDVLSLTFAVVIVLPRGRMHNSGGQHEGIEGIEGIEGQRGAAQTLLVVHPCQTFTY